VIEIAREGVHDCIRLCPDECGSVVEIDWPARARDDQLAGSAPLRSLLAARHGDSL